jgi:intracellular sulfur oxidation DsrE/DsrF family protein
MSKLAALLARRRFLAGAGSGAAALGAAAMAAIPAAGQNAVPATSWKPERHAEDEWLDAIPGKHRFVFDTTTTETLGGALRFAVNYYAANQSGYGLKDSDLAVVVIARHLSTPYAFNDAIWSKYGTPISTFVGSADTKTNSQARQMSGLIRRGAHVGVCQMATRAIASSIARTAGTSADNIYNEIAENLLPNSHLVAAGIVAVNRAQEYGYAFVNGTP